MARARQLRGSLRSLVKDLTKDDAVVKALLETVIQDTVTAIQTGRDDSWIAKRVADKCDQLFDYKDRY